MCSRFALTLLVAMVTCAAAGLDDQSSSSSQQQQPFRVMFPQQFYVTTGTTIPFPDQDPVAQSGAIYYDGLNERVRVDNFWLGSSRSLIADLKHNTGFVINNNECKKLVLTGKLVHAGVPITAVRDPEPAAVRGVLTQHFSGVERGEHLNHVDFFVRALNISGIDPDDDRQIFIPWRTLSRRSVRKEIAPAPAKVPNWRFFGQPLDELVEYDSPSHALEQVVSDVVVTTDFYNFVPTQPDPSIFIAPTTCSEIPADEPEMTFSNDVESFGVQRTLTDLSFTSKAGLKVMSEMYGAKKGGGGDDDADKNIVKKKDEL